MSSHHNHLKRFIMENFLFTDDENSVNHSTSLIEKGIIDSTGILELVAFIENTYGIKIMDNELTPENFDSLNSIDKYITQKSQSTSLKVEENS